MAESLSANLNIKLDFNHKNPLDVSNPVDAAELKMVQAFANGAGKDQASKILDPAIYTLGAGGTATLDLYDGAISGGAANKDNLGLTLALARIKALIVKMTNTPAAGDQLDIGNVAAGWSPPFLSSGSASTLAGVRLGPGGGLALFNPSAAGYAVADTTNHILKFTNSGSTTVSFAVAALGSNS